MLLSQPWASQQKVVTAVKSMQLDGRKTGREAVETAILIAIRKALIATILMLKVMIAIVDMEAIGIIVVIMCSMLRRGTLVSPGVMKQLHEAEGLKGVLSAMSVVSRVTFHVTVRRSGVTGAQHEATGPETVSRPCVKSVAGHIIAEGVMGEDLPAECKVENRVDAMIYIMPPRLLKVKRNVITLFRSYG
jgi:hypothetical protein